MTSKMEVVISSFNSPKLYYLPILASCFLILEKDLVSRLMKMVAQMDAMQEMVLLGTRKLQIVMFSVSYVTLKL